MKIPTITQISITNVMGIKSLFLRAGQITHIRGKNGTGKTSIEQALRAALKGEIHPHILNKDAEKGEIIVWLDEGQIVKRKVGGSRPTLTVQDHTGKNIKSPATWLSERFDLASINPIDLVQADTRKRIEMLFAAADVTLRADKLEEVTGNAVDYDEATGRPVFFSLATNNAGIRIKDLIREIEEKRGHIGTLRSEKKTMIEQLTESLNPNILNMDDVQLRLAKLLEKQGEHRRIAESLRKKTRNEISASYATEIQAKQQRSGEILMQIKQLQEEEEQINSYLKGAFAERDNEIEEKIAEIDGNLIHLNDKIELERESLQNERVAIENDMNTKKIIQEQRTRYEEMDTKWHILQSARNKLREYMVHMLSNLDIPGIEVDGDIMIEGVPWDALNTAKKVEVATKIACHNEAKVIFVDNIQDLDRESLTSLVNTCNEADVQLFTMGVSNHEILKSFAYNPNDGTINEVNHDNENTE